MGVNTVVISVIALVLGFVIMVVLIQLLRAVTRLADSAEKQAARGTLAVSAAAPVAAAPVAVPVAAPAAAAPVQDSVKLTGVDEKTAAVVMAIVCHSSGIPLNRLRFNSIKAVN